MLVGVRVGLLWIRDLSKLHDMQTLCAIYVNKMQALKGGFYQIVCTSSRCEQKSGANFNEFWSTTFRINFSPTHECHKPQDLIMRSSF
jgi:hypothetical protein